MSAAARDSAPVMCLAAFRCTEVRFVVVPFEQRVILECGIVWTPVYQTSAAYVKAGTATVFHSCLIRLGGMPPEILLMRHSWLVHQVALDTAFSAWSLKDRRGSKNTPRYLYEFTEGTVWMVVEPSTLGLCKVRAEEAGGEHCLGKSMTAIFESSNGKLCRRDQVKPPPSRSIIVFRIVWHSSSVFAVARNIESYRGFGGVRGGVD